MRSLTCKSILYCKQSGILDWTCHVPAMSRFLAHFELWVKLHCPLCFSSLSSSFVSADKLHTCRLVKAGGSELYSDVACVPGVRKRRRGQGNWERNRARGRRDRKVGFLALLVRPKSLCPLSLPFQLHLNLQILPLNIIRVNRVFIETFLMATRHIVRNFW